MAKIEIGNLVGNGSTASVRWYGKGRGYGSLYVFGDYSGGTSTLEASPDGGTTWITVEATGLTADGVRTFQLLSADNITPSGADHVLLRGTMAGGTTPDITFVLFDEIPL